MTNYLVCFFMLLFAVFVTGSLLIIFQDARTWWRRDRMYSVLLPVALGAGLLYFLNRKAKAVGNLDYDFGLPKKIRISKGYLEAELPVTFDNASFQELSFSKAYLRLTTGGRSVGNVFQEAEVLLQPRQLTTVPFIIKAPITSILAALPGAIKGGNLPFKVQGTLSSGSLNQYIDKEFVMVVPSLSNLTDMFTV